MGGWLKCICRVEPVRNGFMGYPLCHCEESLFNKDVEAISVGRQ